MVKDRARLTGALAGLAPTGVVGALFAVAGSSASPGEVAGSLALVALVNATLGRAFYALASTAYLLIPAIALGLVWSVVARALTIVRRPTEPL